MSKGVLIRGDVVAEVFDLAISRFGIDQRCAFTSPDPLSIRCGEEHILRTDTGQQIRVRIDAIVFDGANAHCRASCEREAA